MMKRQVVSLVLGILCCLNLGSGTIALALPATPYQSTTLQRQPHNRPVTLPPIPAGLPSYFSFGLFNANTSDIPAGSPWNFRYPYLAGGVNTGDGWATWNSPPGQYALNYINSSRSLNMTPAFVYYQILQSAPNYDEYANLNEPSTMYDYFDDFKLLMQKCAQAGSGPVFVNIEPDLTGVMQQHSSNTNDNAALQPSSVSSSGHPDVQGIPNNFRGVYQALVRIRDLYAPNVSLGLDISPWGASDDITLIRDPSYPWQNHATRTANYLNSLGPGFQLLFFSPSDRDSAWYASQGSNRWWDDTNTVLPNFNRMAEWVGMIIQITQKRALMWQVPNGNRVYRSENNTNGHWQDNRPEYFLNPTSGRQHIQQWADYGFVGLMFGAGDGNQSHYFDHRGDGITNPPPINGNNEVALYSDDDGGYIRLRTAAYYSGGTIPLPGGGGTPVPSTSTPTRTWTTTATRTYTATATRTATSLLSTATHTVTRTATAIPSPTFTPMLPTSTNTPTRTATSTSTWTATMTSTRTATPTYTHTATITRTATAVSTNTVTVTPTSCTLSPNYMVVVSTGATMVPANNQVPGSVCNSCIINIPLPFTYTLYDTPYNSVNVSNKGSLQFDNSNLTGNNTCLPSSVLGDSIMAYWDDLNTNINDNMGIFTSVTGAAPNRVFNIRWAAGHEANDSSANIEARLYEGQPKFELIYGATRTGYSATIGVQKGGDPGRFTQYACDVVGAVQSGTRLVFDRRVCAVARPGSVLDK